MSDLVKDLKEYMSKNQISAVALAKYWGFHPNVINKWFTGTHKPSKIYQYHIKKLLNTKLTKILI